MKRSQADSHRLVQDSKTAGVDSDFGVYSNIIVDIAFDSALDIAVDATIKLLILLIDLFLL